MRETSLMRAGPVEEVLTRPAEPWIPARLAVARTEHSYKEWTEPWGLDSTLSCVF
jgi:hypothetical protein